MYADANSPLTTGEVCALLIKKSAGEAIKQTSDPGCASGSTSAGTPPTTPLSIPDGCFVKVWARHPIDLNWVFAAKTVKLGAQSVSVYDRSELCL